MNNIKEEKMQVLIYTVKEVSKLLHTSPSYIYDLIKAGVLPALKLGSYKIRQDSLISFLENFEGKDLSNPYEIVDLPFNNSFPDNTIV